MSKNPIAMNIFENMKKSFLENAKEEDIQKYQKFGEQFYNSFDVNTGAPVSNCIDMEESLAYVVESLKSGLHPSYLTEDEILLLRAGYGDEWYKKWGYSASDLKIKK
jgi:hypothetical protein